MAVECELDTGFGKGLRGSMWRAILWKKDGQKKSSGRIINELKHVMNQVAILQRKLESILVLGLGKVGTLVGILLTKTGFKVFGADLHEKAGLPFETKELDVADITLVEEMMHEYDAIVSCLPYNLNLAIANRACRHAQS